MDLRPDRDRRRTGGLGRVQRQPQPARHRGLRPRPGSSARRRGSAARRAPVLGHAARHAAEPGRRHAQGHGRHRAGAVGHQGEGARRAGVRAVRRSAARSRASVLVSLRHDACAHGADAGHAAAAHLRRHRRARQGSGRSRLHCAQDQYRDPRAIPPTSTSPASAPASTPPTALPARRSWRPSSG